MCVAWSSSRWPQATLTPPPQRREEEKNCKSRNKSESLNKGSNSPRRDRWSVGSRISEGLEHRRPPRVHFRVYGFIRKVLCSRLVVTADFWIKNMVHFKLFYLAFQRPPFSLSWPLLSLRPSLPSSLRFPYIRLSRRLHFLTVIFKGKSRQTFIFLIFTKVAYKYPTFRHKRYL